MTQNRDLAVSYWSGTVINNVTLGQVLNCARNFYFVFPLFSCWQSSITYNLTFVSVLCVLQNIQRKRQLCLVMCVFLEWKVENQDEVSWSLSFCCLYWSVVCSCFEFKLFSEIMGGTFSLILLYSCFLIGGSWMLAQVSDIHHTLP